MHRTAAALALALVLLASACGGGDSAASADGGEDGAAATGAAPSVPTPEPTTPSPDDPATAAPQPTTPSPTAAAPQSIGTPGVGDGPVVEALIQQFRYQPDPLEVDAGTTVVWTNTDEIFHSVTAGTPDNPMPGLFDGGTDGRDDPPGGHPESFAFTVTEPGTYQYFCTRHPTAMSGTLVVR